VPSSLTHTVEDRAIAVGISLARLSRQADVSYRHVFENRLDRDELDRVERVLIAHECAETEGEK
jgi:hypothetical protein